MEKKLPIENRIKNLIKSVNKLNSNTLEFVKYHLKDKTRLVLKYPRELERPNRIVARGFFAIEKYLLNELAELEEENELFEDIKLRRLV
jgi:hypothetical protein